MLSGPHAVLRRAWDSVVCPVGENSRNSYLSPRPGPSRLSCSPRSACIVFVWFSSMEVKRWNWMPLTNSCSPATTISWSSGSVSPKIEMIHNRLPYSRKLAFSILEQSFAPGSSNGLDIYSLSHHVQKTATDVFIPVSEGEWVIERPGLNCSEECQ